ncbi:lysozyme inhibitor LprI family protein [Fundidesulfovibrio soli]|uniref:lysozyme inhibitor LprI family protein n=1 Tax=Fundidesulfovibrio soli TaxID=2922716 RepID=UPI001FAF18D4|nr:lysozyme inhibitor LprI family protein [Fundidesulfovibrio soli]
MDLRLGILVGSLLAWGLLSSGHAPAWAQNCDNPATDQDMAECAGLRLRAAERDMAVLLDRLEQSEDKELVEALRGAQQAWTAWREAEGRLASVGARDPVLKLYARKKQEAQMTEDRVKDLKSLAE